MNVKFFKNIVYSHVLIFFFLTLSIDFANSNEVSIIRDYYFPPGAYRGELLRQFYHKRISHSYQSMSAEQVRRFIELDKERLLIVESVEMVLRNTFSNLDSRKQKIFSSDLSAALRDIDKVREFVQYGFSYPAENETVNTLIFGKTQLEEWRKGMLSWGVLYNPGLSVWPREFLEIPPIYISHSGQKITGGDWKGAWETINGKIYIPGVLFFKEMDYEVLKKK